MTRTNTAEEGALRSIAVRLYGIWRDDPDGRVRGCIGKLIGKIVDWLRGFHYKDFVHGSQLVTIDDLERAAGSGAENTDGYLAKLSDDLGECLCQWAASCRPQSSRSELCQRQHCRGTSGVAVGTPSPLRTGAVPAAVTLAARAWRRTRPGPQD